MPADQLASAQQFSLDLPGNPLLFLRPADPNAILDAVTDSEYTRDEQLPYWVEHWPSAAVSVPWLLETIKPTSTGIAIELGAGLGVLSALLAPRCRYSVATDIFFESALFCRANLSVARAKGGAIQADWRNPPLKAGCAHYVLASDVLYEERWVKAVLGCISYLLEPGGFAYVADPRRKWWQQFLEQAPQYSLKATIAHSQRTNDNLTTVDIAQLVKCG